VRETEICGNPKTKCGELKFGTEGNKEMEKDNIPDVLDKGPVIDE
jgi:hypothetical protein